MISTYERIIWSGFESHWTKFSSSHFIAQSFLLSLFHGLNIGIKHGFSCINICQVPREVLETEVGGRGFQHLPRDLENVNALKKHVRFLLLPKNWKHLLHSRYFLHYFVSPFHKHLRLTKIL